MDKSIHKNRGVIEWREQTDDCQRKPQKESFWIGKWNQYFTEVKVINAVWKYKVSIINKSYERSPYKRNWRVQGEIE